MKRLIPLLVFVLAACDEGTPLCQGDPDGSVPAAAHTECFATINHFRPRETIVDGQLVWVDELLATSAYSAPANTTDDYFSPGELEVAGCRVRVQAMPRAGAVPVQSANTSIDPDDPECVALGIERAFDLGEPLATAQRAVDGAPLVFSDLRFYGLVPNPGGAVEGSYTISGLTCVEVE